jgi:orotate phosphoribosyltransferase
METMSGGEGEKEGRRTSAIEEVRRKYGIPVISIVTLDDLIGHLSQSESEENMRALEEYKRKYRADR